MKCNKVRLIENIKYYFNLYNYDEYIKIDSIKYIINYLKHYDYNSRDNNLIDLGGGNGLYSYRLKKLGLKSLVTVLDNFESQEFNFKHIKKNIQDLGTSNKYNIVCCLLVLELVEDRLEIISKINDILAKDGVCFISVPNINGINVKIWRNSAKNSDKPLKKLFYSKQKLVSIDVLQTELKMYNFKIIDNYEYGFLPAYATDNKKRLTKKCYIDLNNQLKGYITPSYNLLTIKRIA